LRATIPAASLQARTKTRAIEKSIACLLATLGASALSMSALAADTL
jgi:hypothetical protein